AKVVRGGNDRERHPAEDIDTEAGQTAQLCRVVGEQPNGVYAEVSKDLGAGAVLTCIGRQTEFQIGFHRVGACVLQLVGLQLAQQPDAAALVAAQIEHHPTAL